MNESGAYQVVDLNKKPADAVRFALHPEDVPQANIQPTMRVDDPPSSTQAEPRQSDDLDLSISYDNDDDDFVAITTSPRHRHVRDVSATSDIDIHSESGETIDTISVCESDGRTVYSSDLADSMHEAGTLQFPDPIADPTLRPHTPMEDSMIGSMHNPTDDESSWSRVQESEITIKDFPQRSTLADTMEAQPVKLSNAMIKEPEPVIKHIGKEASPRSSTKSSPTNGIWSIDMRFLLAFLALLLVSMWAGPTTVFRIGSENVGHEMAVRHSALDKILAERRNMSLDAHNITAKDILVYPVVASSEGPVLVVPSHISAISTDEDRLYISLPRKQASRRYYTQPAVKIFDGVCNMTVQENCLVQVAKQQDLIDGLTFVKLNISRVIQHFEVYIEVGPHSALFSYQTSAGAHGALVDAVASAKDAGRWLETQMMKMWSEVWTAGMTADRVGRHLVAESMVHVNKTTTKMLPKLYEFEQQAGQTLRHGMAKAHMFADKTKQVVQDLQDKELGAIRKWQASQKRIFVQLEEDLLSVLRKVNTEGATVLGRAQRNGAGISRRAGRIFNDKCQTLKTWWTNRL